MEFELLELVQDPASWWLKELCQDVINALSPDFEHFQLIVAESFRQAKARAGVLADSSEIGAAGILKGAGTLDEEAYEHPPWKGGGEWPEIRKFLVIMKPTRIREQGLLYEDVSEGMAHEISEGLVLKQKKDDWGSFSRDQIAILRSYYPEPNHLMMGVSACVRDRLADKYAAEHGFGREMLTFAKESELEKLASGLTHEGVAERSRYPVVALRALGLDKNVSLELGGQANLGNFWIDSWERYLRRKSEFHRRFFDYYKRFRSEFLAMPLTASSLLDLVNSKFIEFI